MRFYNCMPSVMVEWSRRDRLIVGVHSVFALISFANIDLELVSWKNVTPVLGFLPKGSC